MVVLNISTPKSVALILMDIWIYPFTTPLYNFGNVNGAIEKQPEIALQEIVAVP